MNIPHRSPRHVGNGGFTLVELLIVIVVIAILAAISVVAYNGIQTRAHTTTIKSDASNNAKKMEQYRILNDGPPPLTATEFRSADLKFSLDSYLYAFYCVQDSGYGFAFRSVNGANIVYTSMNGLVDSPWAASNSAACASIGFDSADVGVWLKGSGDWNAGWTPAS